MGFDPLPRNDLSIACHVGNGVHERKLEKSISCRFEMIVLPLVAHEIRTHMTTSQHSVHSETNSYSTAYNTIASQMEQMQVNVHNQGGFKT